MDYTKIFLLIKIIFLKYSIQSWACIVEHKVTHALFDEKPLTMNNELRAHIAEFEFALKTYGKDNPAKNGGYSGASYEKWLTLSTEECKAWFWKNFYNELQYE